MMTCLHFHRVKDLGIYDKAGTVFFHVSVLCIKITFCSSFHLMNSRYFVDVNKLSLAVCLGERIDGVYLVFQKIRGKSAQ